MMPQELIQMPPDRLLVLRAGMPPIRGRKIVYWRERVFARRVLPAPIVPARPLNAPPRLLAAMPAAPPGSSTRPFRDRRNDDLTLDLVALTLEAAGLEPIPPQGASDEIVEAWVERFIDASAQFPALETDHGR